jgi:hypothetical protein
MNVFWILEADSTPHRGLYSYLSASIGDAICLPIIAGALTAARVTLPNAPGARAIGLLTASAAALATALTQASWLADPNPDLNWTLPAPHTFNAAGWYHAAFSVGLAAYLGYQLGALVVRVRAHGLNRGMLRAFAVAVAGGASFGVLLLLDNLPSLDRDASRSSILLLSGAGLVMAIAAIWVARQRTLD